MFYAVPLSAPADIKENVLNSTSAQLSWRAPPQDKQNGEIVSYAVVLSGNESSHLITHNLTTKSSFLDLTILRPFSEYNVSIAASTAVGTGPFTAPYTFHTPEDG